MNVFERFQTLFVFAGVAASLASAQYPGVPAAAERLRESFRNRCVVATSLVLNFLWNPILAVRLGAVFLRNHPALWVGLVALMVTPCTDWYLVFTTSRRERSRWRTRSYR